MAVAPGLPRPGHGIVYVRSDGRGRWWATWADDYPQPDEAGAAYGHICFEGDGTYDVVEAWARAQAAAERLVAYPACPLPGTPPELWPGQVPLPPA
ncbi:hypothetical protein [Actinospica robiniae]|uniref:hypothetical protein n=1 Tax=Actinospica robiniae TaxID=304901 RepID=UPI0003FBC568|nr:hypothetical protein [Actinospica robiniae]